MVILPVCGGGSGDNGPGSLGALIVRQKQCSDMMIFFSLGGQNFEYAYLRILISTKQEQS